MHYGMVHVHVFLLCFLDISRSRSHSRARSRAPSRAISRPSFPLPLPRSLSRSLSRSLWRSLPRYLPPSFPLPLPRSLPHSASRSRLLFQAPSLSLSNIMTTVHSDKIITKLVRIVINLFDVRYSDIKIPGLTMN